MSTRAFPLPWCSSRRDTACGVKITRRHLLALGAAVPAASALGAGGLAWRWYGTAPAEGRAVLSDDEYDFMQALAEAWMPPGGEPFLSGADADLGGWMDELLSHMDATKASLLKVLMQVLDDAPLLTDASSFRSLQLSRRMELLQGWMTSTNSMFRAAVTGLVVLMGMGWTTHPDVVAVIGPMFRCGWSR